MPNKKNGGNPPTAKDSRVLAVPVKCGKCIECMKAKQREWSIRLSEEIKHRNDAYFITLTLSNENYKKLSEPIESKGYTRDNEIITLAMRNYLERWRKRFGKSVRHWFVSELGHSGTNNIHLHGIIFTNHISELTEIWSYGFVYIGEYVNTKTINYVTKYVSKMDKDHMYYQPKILCSKGIGRNYTNTFNSTTNKFKGKDTKEYYTYHNGTRSALPIYYRNKIYNEDEREQLWLNQLDKNTRYVMGEQISIKKDISNYINLRDYYRMINKRLGYGDDSINENRLKYEEQLREINHLKRTKQEEPKINNDHIKPNQDF